MKHDKDISDEEEIFSFFLENNGYRRTPERLEILKEICSHESLFCVDEIFQNMRKKNFRVTKSTVYSSLALMEKCRLIRRNYFGNRAMFFEKTTANHEKNHLLCSTCGKVISFEAPELSQIQTGIEAITNFNVLYHTFNIYGNCLSGQSTCPLAQIASKPDKNSISL